ncbi:hypothetical protein B4N89_01285 [Embleya scabrispora]|uniref:Uncharacterized protein n=1 Tax=Embleya scabrispora TaxID=159449 RepID=A0A1T3NSG2_9ACTN|nr:hypothetical protein [Embleya scabrispora]OPC79759.1 hypothetical protein B4N89_01285 [Embleya scabrispora]
MSWHDDILSTPCPIDADVRADGRSIVMVPSFFCGPNLFAAVQPELPIVPSVDHREPPRERAARGGLVSSERRGQSMVHVRTRLGTALLDGRVPRT